MWGVACFYGVIHAPMPKGGVTTPAREGPGGSSKVLLFCHQRIEIPLYLYDTPLVYLHVCE